jgi:hypothetical protein
MPISTIPETTEADHSKETPRVKHVMKDPAQEERSTADSPPKGNPGENCQDPPHLETDGQMKEDAPKGDKAGNEDGSTDKDQPVYPDF